MNSEEIKSKMLKENEVEADIKLEFIDLPMIHCYGQETADAIIDALAKTDQIDLFNNKVIQILLDYKWSLTKKYTLWQLFVPF